MARVVAKTEEGSEQSLYTMPSGMPQEIELADLSRHLSSPAQLTRAKKSELFLDAELLGGQSDPEILVCEDSNENDFSTKSLDKLSSHIKEQSNESGSVATDSD